MQGTASGGGCQASGAGPVSGKASLSWHLLPAPPSSTHPVTSYPGSSSGLEGGSGNSCTGSLVGPAWLSHPSPGLCCPACPSLGEALPFISPSPQASGGTGPASSASSSCSRQLCCRASSRMSSPQAARLTRGLHLAGPGPGLSPASPARHGPGSPPCRGRQCWHSSPQHRKWHTPLGTWRAEQPYPHGWGIFKSLVVPLVNAWTS